jgi:RNA polymerase sigma-70 factor (ECF subfamily)
MAMTEPGRTERIERLLENGDRPAAATEAIRSLGPEVLSYLRSILRNEGDAQDAFSQFAENLWRGIGTWRGEGSFRAWTFRLAWNAAINMRNEAWRRRGRRLVTAEVSALADEVRTRSSLRVERQRQALDRLRESLTDEEVSLLTLRIDQELSWAEIAQVFSSGGDPVEAATLMKRFERIKARLARMARDRGLVD